MPKKLALIAAGLAVIALAGCTDAAPTPSASPSSSSDVSTGAEYTLPDVTTACVDGTATIVDDSSNVTVDGDCENVDVQASNAIISVSGSVVNLSMNSSITLVVVTAVENVTFAENANGNKVQTTSTPVVTDGGVDNVVAAE